MVNHCSITASSALQYLETSALSTVSSSFPPFRQARQRRMCYVIQYDQHEMLQDVPQTVRHAIGLTNEA